MSESQYRQGVDFRCRFDLAGLKWSEAEALEQDRKRFEPRLLVQSTSASACVRSE
jgi:hypothetical protein